MVADNVEVFRKVTERLSKMAAPQNRAFPTTEDTEIYRDLGIYGDEMVDLVWWLDKEFEVGLIINPFRYAFHEIRFLRLFRTIRRIIGVEPQYQSLSVRDIVSAIEAKRWPDGAST
jgi:hypothetical protein